MGLTEMQNTVDELKKKTIIQSFDRRQLSRYEIARDTKNADRIRNIVNERQKEIDRLRDTVTRQRRDKGISCCWTTASESR